MPIYPRVGKAVRGLDAVPIFGNFVSFASENIRNSVNTVNRGLKEMSFEISPAIRKELGEAQSAALEKQTKYDPSLDDGDGHHARRDGRASLTSS